MKFKKFLFLSILAACLLCSCKPSYEVTPEDPDMETMSPDEPYDFDFVQINNDVLDYYSQSDMLKIFPFIRDISIDGDNKEKTISLTLDVQPGVSKEAVDILLSDITKQIGNEAQIQDFRLTTASSDSFGSVFELYNYTIKVTQGSDMLYDQTIDCSHGENIPFEPSVDGTTIKESIADKITAKESTTSSN
jgi:hypothetical protein